MRFFGSSTFWIPRLKLVATSELAELSSQELNPMKHAVDSGSYGALNFVQPATLTSRLMHMVLPWPRIGICHDLKSLRSNMATSTSRSYTHTRLYRVRSPKFASQSQWGIPRRPAFIDTLSSQRSCCLPWGLRLVLHPGLAEFSESGGTRDTCPTHWSLRATITLVINGCSVSLRICSLERILNLPENGSPYPRRLTTSSVHIENMAASCVADDLSKCPLPIRLPSQH